MLHLHRPIPVQNLKLLVFDLDGTLIDSAQDLSNSVNATLTHFGRTALPDEQIASFIGDGARTLLERAFAAKATQPAPAELIDQAYPFFITYYREHKLDFTYAYEGVLEALQALKTLHDCPGAECRAMAVLTNKPVRPAQAICEALGLAPYFLRIYGGNSFATKKPDPEGLLALIAEAGVRPDQTVMIGDSHVDVLTARNAGAWSIGCTFGLAPNSLQNPPPDLLVDSPAEWPNALAPQSSVRPASRAHPENPCEQ